MQKSYEPENQINRKKYPKYKNNKFSKIVCDVLS